MSTHTPGPWRVEDTSICTDEFCIAVIEDDGSYEAPHDQRVANANLIAAAPDMLAACQNFIEIMCVRHSQDLAFQMLQLRVQAAIDKAVKP